MSTLKPFTIVDAPQELKVAVWKCDANLTDGSEVDAILGQLAMRDHVLAAYLELIDKIDGTLQPKLVGNDVLLYRVR